MAKPSRNSEQRRLYASATLDEATGEVILKVVNATGSAAAASVVLAGAGQVPDHGTRTVLAAADLQAVNTIGMPEPVAPREDAVATSAAPFAVGLPANSFTVLRVGTRAEIRGGARHP